MKLAVGVRDIAHLRALQAARLQAAPPLRHHTRNAPRAAAALTSGGSIYWVVQGAVAVRQRVLAVEPGTWDDGSACAALVLDPDLVPVVPRLCRAFQGWRYLQPDDAPDDLRPGRLPARAAGLPPALRQELQALCLL